MGALHSLLVAALFIPLWAGNLVFGSAPEAVAAPPAFHPPFRIEVDGRPLDTAAVGGHCGPCIFDVNGDRLDDLVVGDFSGTFRILRNIGTAGAPRFTDGGRFEAGEGFAKVWIYCCIAAQPRFCDLDGDGLEDMLTNSYDPGHCHFFKALPDGRFAAGVELSDVSGTPVRACPAQTKKTESFGSFFEPVDWDDDGDLDLLIGCFDGGLKLRENTGTAQTAAFAPANVVVEAAGRPLTVPRHCCPNVADWDGDGRFDILSGSEEGGVWWLRNVGEPGAPQFAEGETLVAPPSRADAFLSINQLTPGARTQTDVADYDGDGRLDLLVGDYAFGYDFKSDLTQEQMRFCEELYSEYWAAVDRVKRKQTELYSGLDPQDREAGRQAVADFEKSAEKAEFLRASKAFQEGIRPHLRPTSDVAESREDGAKRRRDLPTRVRGTVWVYLRQ